MFRTIFIFILLLVTTSVFSQSRFMAGVSVNPNFSLQREGNTTYNTGFSAGAGANVGMYLGKRLFLLTGIEETGLYNKGRAVYYANTPSYDITVTTTKAWDVPVLFNYIVTNTTKKVSFFVTAGFFAGRFTYINYKYGNPLNTSNTTRGVGYGGLIAGFGCKINLNEKCSILIMPDYKYNHPALVELRTMLMCNFGKLKSKKG